MNEEWKVTDYSRYEVSNLGRVRRYYPSRDKYKILKTNTNNTKGYERVELCNNGQRIHASVHRLVAIAFIPNPLKKPEVNHIDENKTNNIVSNLDWVTGSENKNHSRQSSIDGAHKRPVTQFTKGGILLNNYESISQASRCTGYRVDSICRAANGTSKSSNGFIWKYSEDIVQSS